VIFKGSRYEKLAKSAYTVTTSNGETQSALPIRFIPRTPAGFRHRVTATDRLDLLAYHYYRKPDRFWLIADANDKMDPQELLLVGEQIVIPPDVAR
jgi:hypothetical protein